MELAHPFAQLLKYYNPQLNQGWYSVNSNVRYSPHNMTDAEPGKQQILLWLTISSLYKFNGILSLISIAQTDMNLAGMLERESMQFCFHIRRLVRNWCVDLT